MIVCSISYKHFPFLHLSLSPVAIWGNTLRRWLVDDDNYLYYRSYMQEFDGLVRQGHNLNIDGITIRSLPLEKYLVLLEAS